MELTCFMWFYESISVNQVNDTNTFQGLKPLSFIEWEWKVGYKLSHSLEKLVSHEFHTRILQPIGKGFRYGGFTYM